MDVCVPQISLDKFVRPLHSDPVDGNLLCMCGMSHSCLCTCLFGSKILRKSVLAAALNEILPSLI